MKKTHVALLVAVALVGVAGIARAQDKRGIIPGADCLPFFGQATVHRLSGHELCTMNVPVIVYLVRESPPQLGIFATLRGGQSRHGSCLAAGTRFNRITIVRHAEGAVGSLALWTGGFSLNATPSDMATQECLAIRTGPDSAVTRARAVGWDDQHVLLVTE